MTALATPEIPDQAGRTALVTGVNGGLGYCVSREFARRGARVLMACRTEERAEEAVRRLRAEVPGADVEYRLLDLADLSDIRSLLSGSMPIYDYRRETGERHTAALRNLFNKLLGCIYHCLQERTPYDPDRAFALRLALAA